MYFYLLNIYNQQYTFLRKEHHHIIKRFDKVKLGIIILFIIQSRNLSRTGRRLTLFHLQMFYHARWGKVRTRLILHGLPLFMILVQDRMKVTLGNKITIKKKTKPFLFNLLFCNSISKKFRSSHWKHFLESYICSIKPQNLSNS